MVEQTNQPAQICAPKERDVIDRLAEALRRSRHGLMRPLWGDLSDADRTNWRKFAGAFADLLHNVGLELVASEDVVPEVERQR